MQGNLEYLQNSMDKEASEDGNRGHSTAREKPDQLMDQELHEDKCRSKDSGGGDLKGQEAVVGERKARIEISDVLVTVSSDDKVWDVTTGWAAEGWG